MDYYLFHICLCKIVDCIPRCNQIWENINYINNSNPTVLQNQLDKKYTTEKWDHIRKISKVHKLTYRFKCGKPDTFYRKFMNGELTDLT